MAVNINISLEGTDDLIRNIALWEVRKKARVLDLIERTIQSMYQSARELAPVRTGNLRANIRSQVAADILTGVVYVDKEAFYGRFVELGTHAAAARPYLMPAFEAHWPAYKRELDAIIARPEVL